MSKTTTVLLIVVVIIAGALAYAHMRRPRPGLAETAITQGAGLLQSLFAPRLSGSTSGTGNTGSQNPTNAARY